MNMLARHRTPIRGGLALLLTVPLLGACATGDVEAGGVAVNATAPAQVAGDEHDGMSAMPSPATEAGAGAGDGYTAVGLPSTHVHGVALNPADGRVYLASHDGLFRYDAGGPVRVGPVIDLMGFTVAGPDRFYASGHPGPGVDLPQPVGLIESVDGGDTWAVRSRGGESDFHTLAATGDGVLGFDGALRQSTDDQTWEILDPPVDPYAVAVSPDGTQILITSRSGPRRSTDGGQTWEAIDTAPLLQVVDWADEQTVVGVTPTGSVAVSEDAGATWSTRAETESAPQAVGAHTTADGRLGVLVVTADTVLESSDAAQTFAPLAPS
ncbi:F510_1955 family glycosylhydrolase [Aquipuribacter hungaricus]|uniref:F510_1955 family glycosylhydrolase n=1 Tax=Aquipuribacter hungaricus TaxID=545624 RepID=A0ABV7WKY7_9MICO